jgi:glycopeptide antibiotics resistance protein
VTTPRVAGRRSPQIPALAVRTVAAAYAAALFVVTVAPIRWRGDLARYRSNWRPQLVPVWNLVVNLRDGDRALATLAGAVGNAVLFVPLGFLLPLLTPRLNRLWPTVAAGFLLSTAVELTQLAFPGIRRPDVNDVLANTLGTAAGFLACRLLARRAAP